MTQRRGNLATTTDYAGGLDISTDATHIDGVNAQRFSIAPEFTLDLCVNDQKLENGLEMFDW